MGSGSLFVEVRGPQSLFWARGGCREKTAVLARRGVSPESCRATAWASSLQAVSRKVDCPICQPLALWMEAPGLLAPLAPALPHLA